MKIVYCSDVHSDFEILKTFHEFSQNNIKPDLTIVSGDLIDFAYSKKEDIQEHMMLLEPMMLVTQEEIQRRMHRKRKPASITPYELYNAVPIIAEEITQKKYYQKELKELANQYLTNLDIAEANMNIQYNLIKSLCKNCLFIPGNYDKNLEETTLKEFDLHKRNVEVGGFKICGYGGANQNGLPFTPQNIPPELTVAFNEFQVEDGIVSEIYTFLSEEKPNIIFTHAPPHGYCDEISTDEETIHVGSLGLAKYAEQGLPALICCGHIHQGRGVKKIKTVNDSLVVVVNPGSLKDKHFTQIELDDENKSFKSATLYKIINSKDINSVFVVEKYFKTDNNDLGHLIIGNPIS